MNAVGVKVVPTSYRFGCTRLRGNDCPPLGPQLQQSLLVTMVGFVLGHDDQIGFFDFGQVLDVRGDDVLGDCEPSGGDHGIADQPWVDEDGVGPIFSAEVGSGRIGAGREGEEEGAVGVEMFDAD